MKKKKQSGDAEGAAKPAKEKAAQLRKRRSKEKLAIHTLMRATPAEGDSRLLAVAKDVAAVYAEQYRNKLDLVLVHGSVASGGADLALSDINLVAITKSQVLKSAARGESDSVPKWEQLVRGETVVVVTFLSWADAAQVVRGPRPILGVYKSSLLNSLVVFSRSQAQMERFQSFKLRAGLDLVRHERDALGAHVARAEGYVALGRWLQGARESNDVVSARFGCWRVVSATTQALAAANNTFLQHGGCARNLEEVCEYEMLPEGYEALVRDMVTTRDFDVMETAARTLLGRTRDLLVGRLQELQMLERQREEEHVLQSAFARNYVEVLRQLHKVRRACGARDLLGASFSATEAQMLAARMMYTYEHENRQLEGALKYCEMRGVYEGRFGFPSIVETVSVPTVDWEQLEHEARKTDKLLRSYCADRGIALPRYESVAQWEASTMAPADNLSQSRDIPGLPEEVLSLVLSFVGARELKCAAQVCRRWRACADDSRLWAALAHRELHARRLPLARNSWKHHYLHQTRINALWSEGEYRETVFAAHEGRVTRIQFRHDTMISSGYDGVQLCNLDTGRSHKIGVEGADGHTGPVFNVSFFHNTMSQAVSAGADRSIRVWDINRGVCKQTFVGHLGETFGLQVAPDNNLIFSSSFDKSVRMWDVRTARCARVFEGHTGPVFALKHRKGTLVSGGGDATVKVWDTLSGRCFSTLEGHQGTVYTLQLDEDRMMTAGRDKRILEWSLSTGQVTRTYMGHLSRVNCIQFDDCKLVSCSDDGSAILWDLLGEDDSEFSLRPPPESLSRARSGKSSYGLDHLHAEGVNWLQFDDLRLVTCGNDGLIKCLDFGKRGGGKLRKGDKQCVTF